MFNSDFEEYYEPSIYYSALAEAVGKFKECIKDDVKAHFKSIMNENASLIKTNEVLRNNEREITKLKSNLGELDNGNY